MGEKMRIRNVHGPVIRSYPGRELFLQIDLCLKLTESPCVIINTSVSQ